MSIGGPHEVLPPHGHERSFLPLVLATHTATGGAPHLQQPT